MKKFFSLWSIAIGFLFFNTNFVFPEIVELKFENKYQTLDLINTSTIDFNIIFEVDSNFKASINLFVLSTSLPQFAKISISPNLINSPYDNSKLKIELMPGITIGTYFIEIEARNGDTFFDKDTCYLNIIRTKDRNWTSLRSWLWGTESGNVKGIAFDGSGPTWFTFNSKLIKLQDKLFYSYDSYIPSISKIVLDKKGNVWCGSEMGLVKFDGTYWTTYNTDNSVIPSNTVNSILLDKSDNLWVGSSGGLVKFDGTNWTVYKVNHPQNYPYDAITAMCFDTSGNIWTASRDGLLGKFNGTEWVLYNLFKFPASSPGSASSISCDSQNNIWIGLGWSGICKFDGINPEVYHYQNSIFPIKYLAVDKEDNIWASNISICLAKFKDNNYQIYNNINTGCSLEFVNIINVDDKNNIWFGTSTSVAVYGFIGIDDLISDIDVNNQFSSKDFNFYPNPAYDMIEFQQPLYTKVEIFNNYGELVITSLYEQRIDISGLVSGIYFLKIDNLFKSFIKI